MAEINLKTLSAATSAARNAVLWGRESTGAASPSAYPLPIAGAALFAPGVFLSEFDLTTDGTGDNSAAFNDALAKLPAEGGVVYVNVGGILRTTAPIVINKRHVQIVGPGCRTAQYGRNFWTSRPAGVPVINSEHDGPCIRIDVGDPDDLEANGFMLYGVSLASSRGDYPNSVGVQFYTTQGYAFSRDFVFDRVSITGFGRAFSIVGAADEHAIGALKIQRCNIVSNGYILKTDGSSVINGFVFRDNDCGENGYDVGGGIDACIVGGVFEGNIMESCRDTIRLYGASRGNVIKGNYFEDPRGMAAILMFDGAEFDIGPNYYYSVASNYKVYLGYCRGGRCMDPWMGLMNYFVGPYHGLAESNTANKVPASTASPVPLIEFGEPQFRASRVPDAVIDHSYNSTLMIGGFTVPALKGVIEPSQQGRFSFTSSGVSGPSGTFIVACFALRLLHALPEDAAPMLHLSINNTNAAGSIEAEGYGWNVAIGVGDTVSVVAAVRAHTEMTWFGLNLYPYGPSPVTASNLEFEISQIQLFTASAPRHISLGMSADAALSLTA